VKTGMMDNANKNGNDANSPCPMPYPLVDCCFEFFILFVVALIAAMQHFVVATPSDVDHVTMQPTQHELIFLGASLGVQKFFNFVSKLSGLGKEGCSLQESCHFGLCSIVQYFYLFIYSSTTDKI